MRWITTVILIAILAVVAVYIALNRDRLTSDAELAGSKNRVFSAWKSSDASRLVVKNEKGTFSFEKGAESKWRMIEPRSGEADASAIDAILSRLEFLDSKRAFDEADPSFGLESPKASVTVEMGGEKRIVEIGSSDAGLGGVYARAIDGAAAPKVVRIDKSLFEALDKDASQFRNRKLASLSTWQLERFSVSSKDGRVAGEKVGGNWVFSEPFSARGDSEKIRELQNSIVALEVSDFVNDEPGAEDLKGFGLDEPRFTVTLEGAERSVGTGDDAKKERASDTFQIGSEAGDDLVYLMKKGSGVVKVSDTIVTSLRIDFDALRDHRVFSRPAEELTRIEIIPSGEGKKTVLAREEKKEDEDSFAAFDVKWRILEPAEAPAEKDKVDEFARKFKELTAASFAPRGKDVAAFGLAEPSLRIRATLKSGGENWTLLVGSPTDDGGSRYVKSETEESVYIVPSSAIEPLEKPWYSFRDRKLLDFLSADAQEVSIEREGKTHRYVQKGAEKKWYRKLEDGSDSEVERTEVTSFLSKLTALRAEKFTSDDVGAAASLGIGPGALAITVRYTKEREKAEKAPGGEDGEPAKDAKERLEETKTLRVSAEKDDSGNTLLVLDGLDLLAAVRANLSEATTTLLEKTGAIEKPKAKDAEPDPPNDGDEMIPDDENPPADGTPKEDSDEGGDGDGEEGG